MGDREKPHRCTVEGCTAAFNRRDRWTQHIFSHNNIKAYACREDGCSKSYTSRSHLERHVNSAHRGYEDKDETYTCSICLKEYANRQNLKRHLKTHKSTNTPLHCETCNLVFRKKHMLSSHMYQHTGKKPFNCEFCPKEFVKLIEKKKHMRCHKNYECSEEPDCQMKFDQWSKYQKHLKIDHESKEFICDTCGRTFKHRIHIIRHVRFHDTVRHKYECPYKNCKRFYSRNSNLKQHLLVKHEKIAHECKICKLQLSTKAKLKEHTSKIHGSEQRTLKPNIKGTGRKPRKDCGSVKITTALKLAGLFPIKSINEHEKVMEIHVAS